MAPIGNGAMNGTLLRYTAGELAQRINGKPLSPAPLLAHLNRKA